MAIDLAVVRDDLAAIEALEDELHHRLAHLRATLPLEQFRLVWALLDAQDRLGLAERVLAEHRVGRPARGQGGGTPIDSL